MDSARKHMYTYIYTHVSPCLCPCLCLHICMFVSISYVYIDTSHSNPTPQHSFQPSPFLYFQICSLTVSNLVFISLNIFAYLLISLYGSNLSIRACWLPLWPATSTALPPTKKKTCYSTSTPRREGNSERISWCKRKITHWGHRGRWQVMVTFLSIQVHLLSFYWEPFTVLDVGTTHVNKPWFWALKTSWRRLTGGQNANYSVKILHVAPATQATLLGETAKA